jgi:hypothetical protein
MAGLQVYRLSTRSTPLMFMSGMIQKRVARHAGQQSELLSGATDYVGDGRKYAIISLFL